MKLGHSSCRKEGYYDKFLYVRVLLEFNWKHYYYFNVFKKYSSFSLQKTNPYYLHIFKRRK